MSFGNVFQRQIEVQFLGQTDRGQNIVCLMGMDLHRDLFLDDRDHRFALVVEGRHLGNIVPCCFFLCQILFGFEYHIAHNSCRGHTGAVAFVLVASLRILAEGAFHSDRIFDDHVIHADTGRLDSDPCAADGI